MKRTRSPILLFVLTVLTALTVLTVLAMPSPVAAAEFQVDNAVYAADAEQPSVRTTTVFLGHLVYDFMESPSETITFDAHAGQFTLIDRDRRLSASTTLRQVSEVVSRLQRRAAEADHPYLRFLARPEFTRRLDPTSGQFTLASPWLTYRVEPIDPGSAEVATQYREFADAYGQINAVLNPGAIPPMARMTLNAELAERGLIPREIELTLRRSRRPGSQATRLRSEHRFQPTVDADARERVAEARRQIEVFRTVSFQQYRQSDTSEP